jgi:hypothetical protein
MCFDSEFYIRSLYLYRKSVTPRKWGHRLSIDDVYIVSQLLRPESFCFPHSRGRPSPAQNSTGFHPSSAASYGILYILLYRKLYRVLAHFPAHQIGSSRLSHVCHHFKGTLYIELCIYQRHER